MKYPFIKQSDLKDCGVCCLLMLTRYFGGCVSKEYLREITNTTKQGVTAYDLIEGAKKIGFQAYGVNGSILELKKEYTPCIAHVTIKKSYYHFIVIYKIDHNRKRLLIADPNDKKLRYMSFLEFEKISTNNYILLNPSKKILYVESNYFLKNFISKFIKHKSKFLIICFCFSFLITLLQIILSFQFKTLLEYIINYKSPYNLLPLSLIFLSIILIKEISSYKRNNLMNEFNHDLDKSLFINIYNHILSLPYLYYKNRTTGEIVSRINDLNSIREIIGKYLYLSIDSILMIISFLTLFVLSNDLTFCIIIILILILIIVYLFGKPLDNSILEAKVDSANLNSYLVETINGIETIKNQNITPYIKKKVLLKYSKFNNNSLKYNRIFIIEEGIKNLFINIGNFIILTFGSYLVIKNKLDIATLITYITLTNYVFSPIELLTSLILTKKEAKISFNRINELYEIEEEKDKSAKFKTTTFGNIIVNNLSYSYNNKDKVLKDISLNINKNDKILIYGKSGSGKSTLAKILAGNLKIDNNMVMFDNKDINRISNLSLNKDICYISNNETIFTDTIYNNILLDKNTDIIAFDNAVKCSLVDEFVFKNTLAYDTLLEENGFNLSGGQKQRIILARSLLKDSNIYILDEALNQVDIEKERQILNNLFQKYKNKTFIYISHRFHNADLFDKRYKIEEGASYEECL